MRCRICKGELWVCEDHPDQPWDSYHQQFCGAGMPCECQPQRGDLLTNEEEKRLKNVYPIAQRKIIKR